jgi:serine/threonine protein kinase
MPYLDPSALLNGSKYVDARCDVYAMGIILHQLVCGAHYWVIADIEFPQLVKIITKGEANNIIDIERVNTSFSGTETLKTVIRKTTTFDHDSRIGSINEMISLLGDAPIKRDYPKVDFTIASPVLIIEDGSAKGAMNMIAVKEGELRELNRTNLDITNKTISRKNHAFIERQGNKYFIFEGEGTEGKGTNGTFLNGTRLKRGIKNKVEIRHTDRVRFADLWTRFVFLKKD